MSVTVKTAILNIIENTNGVVTILKQLLNEPEYDVKNHTSLISLLASKRPQRSTMGKQIW